MARPRIILLSLEKQPWFDGMHTTLLSALKADADVEEITELPEARRAFGFDGRPRPQVLLVTDAALLALTKISLVHEAASYARSGGTLIFMGHFASFARPSDIGRLFDSIGLPWESGDYHRTTFDVNQSMRHIDTGGLVPSYSQKALHLRNVSPDDAVYLPSGASTQSLALGPRAVDTTRSPAVFGTAGRGGVGYVGDVNAEEASTAVVLAMCGIGP